MTDQIAAVILQVLLDTATANTARPVEVTLMRGEIEALQLAIAALKERAERG